MTLFHGLSAFPLTPADPSGQVDTTAFVRILQRIKDTKTDSIGLLGSTGGYAFLSRKERLRAVEAAVDAVGGNITLMVGVGAMRTSEAENLARDAKAVGADGLLLAPVSYTPLNETEVYEHYAAVAKAGQLPLCIYNNPGTTHFTFTNDLISRLSKIENISAVKMPLPAGDDFEGELSVLRGITPPSFKIGYSGDLGALPSLLAGGDAFYSVVGGILPAETVALVRAAQAGDAAEATRINDAFEPLWTVFKEVGSFRTMYEIASLLDLCKVEPPRPILPIPEPAKKRVAEAVSYLKEQVTQSPPRLATNV